MSTTIPARYVGQILGGIAKLSPYIDDLNRSTGIKRITLGDDLFFVIDVNSTDKRVRLKEPLRNEIYALDPYTIIIWSDSGAVTWFTADGGESVASLEKTESLLDVVSQLILHEVDFHENANCD